MSNPNACAFPTVASDPGLTIREEFAKAMAQAMIGTAAAPCLLGLDGCEPNTAAAAVKMADALIAELAKPVVPPPNRLADVERYLVERIDWLTREIDHGGKFDYLNLKREETDYILKNVREIAARSKP